MAAGSVPLVLSPEPFSRAVAYLEQPAGRTLRAALVEAVRQGSISAAALRRTVVYVDGVRLECDQTLGHVLREGEVVNIVVEPLGGGGGRKEIGQVLMQIAVIAVSMWVGGGAGGAIASTMIARVASAAVLTLGQAAVAALFAPDTQNKAKTNERYALQSASNQYRPWSAFPLALGEVVVAPDFAAKTYTQAIGDDVWIYGILGLHAGACTMSEMKIGDTLVSSMGPGDFRKAEHLTPGPRTFSIYPNDVDQLDLQEELEATVGGATPVIRAASAEGESFEFDFFLPGGLHFQKDDGRVITAAVTLYVRYRPIDEDGVPTGAGAWSDGLTVPLSSTTKEPWRVMRALALPLGRYEFEIKRSPKPDGNEKRRDDVAITAIRAIAFRKPVTDETLSIVEFAVRATALNQGTLAPITCRIIPLCETWNGAAWTAPQPTSNPAALVRWLLTGPAPARPLLLEQADVRLRDWSDLCEEYNWKAGHYLIDDRRQADVLALLEQAGRASLFWDGTQTVASAWVEKPAPRQLFTGANLKDHRWTIIYPEPVHALRVEFQNIDQGGEPDELYVYADGYGETGDSEAGITAAVLVEALRLEGQKTAERAYRDGRWELGRRLHQRRIDTWTADAEHLVSSYGDRVRLAWQRVDGGTSCRVRCRRWTGGMVTGLRLSQPVEMVPGESYAVDIRLVGEVIVAVPVINEAEDAPVTTREIQFAIPREPGSSPKRDDLIAFGVPTRISEDTEIIGIEPGKGLTASLTGVRYVAPLLMAGETGPIPPLQTRLSRARAANPPTPILLGVQPDPSGIRVSYAMPPWAGSPIVSFAARWRPTPAAGEETGWISLQGLGAGANVLVTPPIRALPVAPDDDEGRTLIDVEIRAVTASGQTSPEPLRVEGIEVREDPWPPVELTVTPEVRTASDGSSHGVLHVSALPLAAADGVDMIVEVRLEPIEGAVGDWEPASKPLPAANPQGDLLGLLTGERYRTRAAWRSAGGWPSPWADGGLRTVPAGSNVASDSVNTGGVPSEQVADQASQVPSLALTLAGAQLTIAQHEATLYAAATGLVDRTNAILATLNTPTTGVVARLTAVESQVTTNNSAAVSRLNALEATVNTPTTGLSAVVATHTSAISSLTTGKADVSVVTVLQAQVNTPATGILARLANEEAATSNLLSGKADASRVALVEASIKAVTANAMPYGFADGGLNWISGYTGSPTTTPAALATEGRTYPVVVGVGPVMQVPAPANPSQIDTANMGVLKLQAGARYRVTVRGRRVSGFPDGSMAAYIIGLDSNYALPGAAFAQQTVVLATGNAWYEATVEMSGNDLLAAGAVWVRGLARAKGGSGVSSIQFDYCKVEDITAAADLSARASALETATTNLQTGKADASRVTTLEAQVSQQTLSDNPKFAAFPVAQGAPTGWQAWAGQTPFRVAGETGGYAAQIVAAAGAAAGIQQVSPVGRITPLQYVVLRGRVRLDAGNLFGAAVYLSTFDATLNTVRSQDFLSLSADPDSSGALPGSGILGRTYSWSKLIRMPANADVSRFVLYAMNHFVAVGSMATANTLTWFECSITAATPAEIAAGVALPALSSTVTELQTTVATLEGRLESRALLQVQAGNQVAGMQLLAASGSDVSYSTIDFWASAVRISNGGSNPVAPFEVRGDVVRMQSALIDRLSVGTAISVGPFGFAVALEPKLQPAKDGEVVSYGGNLGQVPNIVWPTTGLDPLNAGESYLQYAESHTATGFIARRKIQTPATPTAKTLTAHEAGPGTDTSGSTGPARMILRGAEPVSVDNTYVITGQGTVTFRSNVEFEDVGQEATMVLRVWQRISGVWSAIGFLYCYATTRFDRGFGVTGVDEAVPAGPASESFTCSPAVEGWGLSLYSRTGGNAGVRSNTMKIEYTAQATGGGIRTATAGNQRPNIEIRLKNAA